MTNLGPEMSPISRGIVQRMTEVAWTCGVRPPTPTGFRPFVPQADQLSEADEEIDILHERLTNEIAAETMPTAIGAQVTLLARFYERLGDHAVNLARRVEMLEGPAS